jgi:hypothetical protein
VTSKDPAKFLPTSVQSDLKIKLASTERSKHRRIDALKFTIKTQAIPKGAAHLS